MAIPPGRARAFERKQRRTPRALGLEQASPLRQFFTGGLECDDRVDPLYLERFTADFFDFQRSLGVAPAWGEGVELKFRRLGRHRAGGLYYPDHQVLVVDLASARSFAHEFGHLMDYRASRALPWQGNGALSSSAAFYPWHELIERRMRGGRAVDHRLAAGRGRLSWRYFASPAECFARAFEQCAAELVPEPSSLLRAPSLYREDRLYFESIPPLLLAYFADLSRARGILKSLTESGGAP